MKQVLRFDNDLYVLRGKVCQNKAQERLQPAACCTTAVILAYEKMAYYRRPEDECIIIIYGLL